MSATRASGGSHKSALTIYTFGPTIWVVDPSPFVAKLLTWLRLAKVDFTARCGGKSGPSGRWPWAVLANPKCPGTCVTLTDSERIIDAVSNEFNVSLDDHLSAADRIQSEATRLLIENVLYQCVVRNRWVDHPDDVSRYYPMPLPSGLRRFLVGILRKRVIIPMLDTHGNGDLSDAEYHRVYVDCIKHVEQVLGGKAYMLSNERPSSLDATVYAFIGSLLGDPISCPARDYFLKSATLVAHAKRVEALAFPDKADWIRDGLQEVARIRARTTRNLLIGAAVLGTVLAAAAAVAVRWWAFRA